MSGSAQKFVSRNRAPRVQIEYDIELYGSEKKVQLPFVMGVMSDLSGKSISPQPSIDDRRFLEIDADNFDERMRGMQPRAAFSVPNTLTGEGNLDVDLTFERMEDFAPEAIAAKVAPLRELLEARTQLSNLLAYMDGKVGAAALIEEILANPALLSALAGAQQDGADRTAVLDSLRALARDERAAPDPADGVLDRLKSGAPGQEAQPDTASDVLAALAQSAPKPAEQDSAGEDVLAELRKRAPAETTGGDATQAALDALRRDASPDAAPDPSVDDTLASLANPAPQKVCEPDTASGVLDSLVQAGIPEDTAGDDHADTLAGLAAASPDEASEPDDLESALDSLANAPVEQQRDDDTASDTLTGLAEQRLPDPTPTDDLALALDSLAGFEEPPDENETADTLAALSPHDAGHEDRPDALASGDCDAVPGDDLTDVMAGLAVEDHEATEIADPRHDEAGTDPSDDIPGMGDADGEPADGVRPEANDLDDLLGDLGVADPDEPEGSVQSPTPFDSASEAGGLEDLLGDLGFAEPDEPDAGGADLLDDLPVDLDSAAKPGDAAIATPDRPQNHLDDLDDLLGDPGDPSPTDETEDTLDDLLGVDVAPDVEVDDLLNEAPAPDAGGEATLAGGVGFAFGFLTGDRPEPERLNRTRFRIALMGDFSGRAARGLVETGDALAARAPVLLDTDTVEDVIRSFATTLVLPIGKEGAGVAVKLNELDDLHPDELYENVPILSELRALRAQLATGTTSANAAARLREWGEAHATPVAPPRSRSAGNAMPANLKLSEFQRLIGDNGASLATASPVEDLIAQIVGPHVRTVADADTVAMQQAVDAALTSAMRLILHHPEFQAVESQWRSLDLIARSIETDDTLDVTLYDISAEEIGADLAATDDLARSGLVRLLTELPLDPENGRGGYSAIVGLYSFEETPPHAELLGRIARVAAHVDAPFLAALSSGIFETEKADRHPLVATAWDGLRAMPEAHHLGLAAPRFLLRRPYGAKSEPIHAFDFEEFTMAEGLRGMLWANPVVLVAILLARSYRKNGAHMGLGSIMSLGEMPYHLVTDQYGDQVALPCTERNLTLDKVEKVMARGLMPVVSIKGRDEIRLASFQSMAGGDILGPWSDAPPPPPSPPRPAPISESGPQSVTAQDTGEDLGLDDLLAGFDDTAPPDGDLADVDADLAALLEDL
ncbi:type VI secretion system contractile sheath small subunit [Sedimentitalea sp. XS_ASV28]|uniref:type VI secretion system contractile sheath small subunit n=1 Tax=Sedimentitalea sp. XS_ASV28 TaxID=3241296 RepID=UPI00351704B3